MTYGHCKCGVAALLGVEPQVGKLGRLAVVGRHHDRLGALVSDLGEEVRVRGAGLGDVGAPHHQEVGVVPVGALRHVGLLAPCLGAGRRQVGVPVIEAQTSPSEQRQVARAGRVGDHRHGRDRRETNDAVGTIGGSGVNVGGRDQFGGFLPSDSHEAALAAIGFVARHLVRVFDDRSPGLDRVGVLLLRLTPERQQALAHQRVLDAVGAVQIPGSACASGASPRFVIRQVRSGAWVVQHLRLPGHDPVLDVDVPAAGAGAVHAVRGAHDLVVLPPAAVAVLPGAVFGHNGTVPPGEGLLGPAKELKRIENATHGHTPRLGRSPDALAQDHSELEPSTFRAC